MSEFLPKILFENEFFLAVDKPADWLCIPARQTDDPRPVLQHHLSSTLKSRIFVIHRLDASVSGLVLFAKSSEAHKAANIWFEQHQVKKLYTAFTECMPHSAPIESGVPMTWDLPLVRGKRRTFVADYGKPSRTNATPINYTTSPFHGGGVRVLTWKLQPLTGRTHQLRVHLASNGFPIVADVLYGASPIPATSGFKGIALRSTALDFSNCVKRADFKLPEEIRTSAIYESALGC